MYQMASKLPVTMYICHLVSEKSIEATAMEAVPKFPMLKFDLKLSPDNGDFLETIKKLIKVNYSNY